MSIKLVDTAVSMGNFPVAYADAIECSDGERLQKKIDDGTLGGGAEAYVEMSQEEYDALSDEEKSNGTEYRTYDTGRIYKYGVVYGEKKPIELTYAEYKALEEAGGVEADVDYTIISNESGVLLSDLDTNHGDSEISTYEVIETLKSDVENLIDDTDLTSKTSTLSASKIRGSVTHGFNTQDGKVKYLKLKLDISTISVVDIYGGKIEILGANNSGANPDYKTVKVVRHSYGNWSSYDATQVPAVVNTKIGNLYYYPTDNYYYLQLNNYANFTVTGALISPEMVTSLPAEESAMTLIPESVFATKNDLATQTANRQVKTFDNTGLSTEKWYKICSALTGGVGCNIKLTASRADSTATVQYFSVLFRDNRYRYTSSYISRERTVYESMLIAEYSAYIIADANNDIWVHIPSYGKAIIEVDTRAITIDGTAGTPVADYVYSSFEHQYDERINDSATNTDSTWSSSKIASEIGAKITKTQYRGSQSVDIATSGKLTFIFSSMYASQAGCYMLLSNYNTTPLLIELGRNDIGQFKVTATNKSFGVDTITVTTGAPEYSWYILQF